MQEIRAILSAAASAATFCLCAALLAAAPARAENCPGNPDALGTSRTLTVDFDQYQQVGTLQYKQTLPLADHEVVITFDDGPVRMLSDKVLDILNAQCVRVTYFIVGEMAHYYPDVVRREYASGDTIGTHSQDHPLPFEKLSDEKTQWEIDQGIASVGAALGDPAEVAPFFRIPGLGRSKVNEEELAKRRLTIFSVDVVADDWLRHITPQQIVQRAMSRLEKAGKGILLLHDIHPATVLALPELLKQLKQNGFHVVQAVPPAYLGPEMAGGPKVWARAAAMPQARLVDQGAAQPPSWPRPNAAPAAASTVLAAPDQDAFAVDEPARLDTLTDQTSSPQWPQVAEVTAPDTAEDFPAPGLANIGVSLRDEELVGTGLGLRPAIDVPAGDHDRFRHAHVRGRHPARRSSVQGQRADLLSRLRSLTASLTPAAPPVSAAR
ncbi:MAG TPA: polysaccharide deacetylase family protein [Xanthobacteraceae bacterium]|nr:polysaccharide deacetylase family protein [Xanthobacteraceae bacterium]